MLSSSIRRVVRTSAVSLSSVTPSVSVGASSNGLLSPATQRAPQRRYSSSKPPVPPNDGSRRIDASSQAPAKGVNPAGEKRAAKRKGKDSKSNQHPAFLNLPSVPSTQHLQPDDVHVASFFSIHRPISVTTTIPPTTNAEAFNAIFDSKKQSKKGREDVIYTLSSAVNLMENAIHHNQQYVDSEQDDLRHAVTQASVSNAEAAIFHLDSLSAEDLKASVEESVRRLPPFNPPPPPEPINETNASEAMPNKHLESQQTLSQIFSTVLTIRESTHSDGRKTYVAHMSPLVRTEDMEAPGVSDAEAPVDEPQGSSTTYIERLRHNRTMHALSTRRRRKLKMKKHKYKKLLRKTRHLRRKLDKA
ncbi:hypothetical protein VTN77DRAFT_7214 [Rasamsonia byssochlamydoides]|uniref:mitochondrial 37S ribosomal protein mS38 n=1 Tax=Rasamsonia byssochlamydoides TaxID=89139 RepID=UPI003742BAF9